MNTHCRSLFFCLFLGAVSALSGQILDAAAFAKMTDAGRFRFIHDFPFEKLDSAAVSNALATMLPIALEKKDARSLIALKYYQCLDHIKLKFSPDQNETHLSEMESLATEQGFPVEAVVARHYHSFEQFNAKKIPLEQQYVAVLNTFSDMERIGFEAFRDYQPDALLNHLAEFMLDLNDHEKALHFLLVAERFIQPTRAGSYHYTMTLNRLQSCFQEKKDISKAIEYAQKIIDFNEKLAIETPGKNWRAIFWQGLASLDLANFYIEQGNLEEGERHAAHGYELCKNTSLPRNAGAWQAEFDALQVLISIKLKTGKTGEATPLLHRSEELKRLLDAETGDYLKQNLRFFKNRARYHELKSEFAEAFRCSHFAEKLQDSLDRRNDARKFEQLQRRVEAEKFQQKIRLLETEKQTQTFLRNAALLILLLTLALGWMQFNRIRARRRLAEVELNLANKKLESLAAGFRRKTGSEKAEMEHLRLEIEKSASSDEREKWLGELTRHAVLTNEDWSQFRALFEKVHPGFIEELTAQFPGITAAELRLLVFEKLGLSDSEIAGLLGISRSTVKQTRWRMRKKTG